MQLYITRSSRPLKRFDQLKYQTMQCMSFYTKFEIRGIILTIFKLIL